MSIGLPLALTMGEPAGIGGELTLKAWLARRAGGEESAFVVIDDPDRLRELARRLSLDVPIEKVRSPREGKACFPNALPVLAERLAKPAVPGRLDPENATAVIRSIERAVDLVRCGKCAAVVTNPIHKHCLQEAGFAFPGHTEFLAALADIDTLPVMMLACVELKVVPVTIHVSLIEAARRLTSAAIVETARITAEALRRDFAIARPRLAVAGLNPHAGENGAMGGEDIDIVAPAVSTLRAEGIDAFGPAPADTLFHPRARQRYDAAICMYHDQALIPIKTIDFDGGVNVTLGLPFVRTSPDHGTALDIAGHGEASVTSLLAAMGMGADMALRRAAGQ